MNPDLPPPLPRSAFVTVLGWVVMVASALVTPISVITVFMLLAGSHGASAGLTLEGLAIIAGPPATLAVGIGLLFRRPWARLCLLALLLAVLAFNGRGIIKGPTPQTTYISASGVPTTVLASNANYSLPVIAISIGLFVALLNRKIRSEFET